MVIFSFCSELLNNFQRKETLFRYEKQSKKGKNSNSLAFSVPQRNISFHFFQVEKNVLPDGSQIFHNSSGWKLDCSLAMKFECTRKTQEIKFHIECRIYQMTFTKKINNFSRSTRHFYIVNIKMVTFYKEERMRTIQMDGSEFGVRYTTFFFSKNFRENFVSINSLLFTKIKWSNTYYCLLHRSN